MLTAKQLIDECPDVFTFKQNFFTCFGCVLAVIFILAVVVWIKISGG